MNGEATMDERRTEDQGTTPPEDMPTQAFPPTPPTEGAAPDPADAGTGSTTPPSSWQQPSTASTSPPASWQQPTTSTPPASADQPPPATATAPPQAPTWQQAAPPAAVAATGWQQPQPQSQWVQPAPMVAQEGGTTGLAKVGSIILILFGLLTTLAGLLITVAVNTLRDAFETQFPQFGEAFANVAVTLGIVILVIGIVEVLTGIFSWRGSGWARVVGIIYGLLFGLLFLAGLLGPRVETPDVDTSNSLATGAIGAIGYLFVAVVFLFRYRKSSSG
jgi:hypothetical protein